MVMRRKAMTMYVKNSHYLSTLMLMNSILGVEKINIESIYIERLEKTYKIILIAKKKIGIAYISKDFIKYFFKTKEKVPTLKIFFQNVSWKQDKF
jgi:hypothetical protein